MKIFQVLVIAICGLVGVKAACDNQCSGHGTCGTDDVCTCYDNWGIGLSHDSGDCSDRICPHELSWVDLPDMSGTFHKYSECAGRGICARDTGECQCFAGYEGKACQRMSCANGCSGHGTCEYIEDTKFPATWNDDTSVSGFDESWANVSYTQKFSYHLWDSMKTRTCMCDAHYGEADCSKRMCPYGNDVLDNREYVLVSAKHQTQKIIFAAADTESNLLDSYPLNFALRGSTFALTFKSLLNETFTTMPIVMKEDQYAPTSKLDLGKLANDIKLSLLKLPNSVVDGVTVNAYSSLAGDDTGAGIDAGNVVVHVTFTGPAVEGPQHLLQVETAQCTTPGCTPMITGLAMQTVVKNRIDFGSSNSGTADVDQQQAADYHSYECGRRGKCDYTTGLCGCFTGYTGENCNTLTTLV